jgi:magnesium chelatase family protein
LFSPAQAAHRVQAGRAEQQCRGFHIPHRDLRRLADLDDGGERTLEMAMRRLSLSARAHDLILKAARTVADIAAAESLAAKHIADAVQYRVLGRGYPT